MSSSRGQASSQASPTRLASQPASLPPPCLTRPARDEVLPPASRKRRSDHGLPDGGKRLRREGGFVATEELLKPAIVIRAYPPRPLAKPCTLLPLMLLPREHLPLSCLDLSAPHGDLPACRQFQSHIRILDLEGRLGSNLLIACSHGGSTMFAIERDEAGLYALCRLGSWVDAKKLSQMATAVCLERMPAPASATAQTSTLEPALVTAAVHKEQRRKRLAIAELQSIVRRRPASQLVGEGTLPEASPAVTDAAQLPEEKAKKASEATLSHPPRDDATPQPVTEPAKTTAALPTPPETTAQPLPAVGEAADPEDAPTADGIFQNIRHQYAEALYHSMGSLAYFAKGPLSRARAAFHLDCDANLEMDDLIEFLKSLVMTTTVIDKKYRETIPAITERLRTLGDTSDVDSTTRRRASKKAKKVKLGSNGLYAGEDGHVKQWWSAHKPEVHEDEVVPRAEEVKYAISSLRTRETQLQMILILEILALETMRPAGDGESQLPGMPAAVAAEVTAAADTPAKKTSKKRSKHNLPLLIDVHADRLCIWQSTTSDEVRAMAESQLRGGGEGSSQGAQSDPLKDFCVDIIVPFFSARLPLVCDGLNRKLGGPVAPPSRSRPHRSHSSAAAASSSSSSSRHHVKPGMAARRSAPANKSARSLERVLSTERLRRSVSRGPNDAIAQMRSATAAPIPGLKREMSEPAPLAGIPRMLSRSQSQVQSHSRRASSTSLKERPANAGLAKSVSDMAAATTTTGSVGPDDPRARKKAMVEAELQEAISALKKPNRGLAGKAVVEAAERRLSGAIKRPKKSRPAGERVQVKATPVNNRFRDVFGEQSQNGGGGGGGNSQLLAPPPLFVVASSPRVAASSPRVVAATPLARKLVQATPVRTSTRVMATAGATTMTATMTTTTTTTTTTLTPGSDVLETDGLGADALSPAVLDSAVARRVCKPLLPLADVEAETVLASSPLQARSVAPAGKRGPARMLFATPIKASGNKGGRLGEEDDGKIGATPVSRPGGGGGGGGLQTLYQQMGWDDMDDLDDLA